MMIRTLRVSCAFVIIITSAFSLCGCGPNVELKGGIFDATGLNRIGTTEPEKKVAKRNTLVEPPSVFKLPYPEYGLPDKKVSTSASELKSWPIDPDKIEVQNKEALKKYHKEFCEEARNRYRLKLDFVLAAGPLGSCDKSIIRNLTGKGLFERSIDTSAEQ
ncbi:MAG: hypothetical protein TECD_00845 [Hyphomicrobiaceae bacterium hypho_1]